MKVLDKIKVDVANLKIGMYVCELDRPWNDSPFLLQGFMLNTEKDIRRVQKTCDYVYVDSHRSVNTDIQAEPSFQTENSYARKKAAGLASQHTGSNQVLDINKPTEAKKILGKGKPLTELPQPLSTTKFIDELPQARKIYGRLYKETSRIFDAVDTDQTPIVLPMIGLVLEVLGSIQRNPSAFEWIAMTNPDDKSVQQHCINVCIIAMHFGHHIGLPDRFNRLLGLAGLTFDIGKLLISDAILKKTTRLSEAEMRVMQMHTSAGHNILEALGNLPLEAIQVAQRHHERLDGSGYPNQLKGESIDLLSRIIGIVDTYNAIITAKHHSDRSSPSRALDELYKMRNTAYDGELVEAFIRVAGMFPIGTAIQTQTGEIGLVVANNMKSRLSPSVLMVLDSQGRSYGEEKIIDFAQTLNENGKPRYSIKQAVNAASYDINTKDFFRN